MNPMLNIAVIAARKAGRIINQASSRLDRLIIDEKGKNDFVTNIDKASEEEIIYQIKKAYPDHSILAEESGEHPGNEYVWIIDPLDGTNNYLHGYPQFSISIAIQYKGTIEHGLVFDPIRDELFTASRGDGARLNQQRLRVSEHTKIEQALIATGFNPKATEFAKEQIDMVSKLITQGSAIRWAGSAALDLAYVAAGRLDGLFERQLSLWDIAAGYLLIKESGGLISDLAGGENYLQSGNILAGNPKVFKQILKLLN